MNMRRNIPSSVHFVDGIRQLYPWTNRVIGYFEPKGPEEHTKWGFADSRHSQENGIGIDLRRTTPWDSDRNQDRQRGVNIEREEMRTVLLANDKNRQKHAGAQKASLSARPVREGRWVLATATGGRISGSGQETCASLAVHTF